MKNSKMFLHKILVIIALFLSSCFSEANANLPSQDKTVTNGEIVLNSNSFNAKKQSKFMLNSTCLLYTSPSPRD